MNTPKISSVASNISTLISTKYLNKNVRIKDVLVSLDKEIDYSINGNSFRAETIFKVERIEMDDSDHYSADIKSFYGTVSHGEYKGRRCYASVSYTTDIELITFVK